MKLKTRVKVAWFELAFIVTVLILAVGVDLARPRPPMRPTGVLMDALLTAFILAPLCVTSWSRLRRTRAQRAELGPDAEPSVDLWTAPGAPGVIGCAIVVVAIAAALTPALLFRA